MHMKEDIRQQHQDMSAATVAGSADQGQAWLHIRDPASLNSNSRHRLRWTAEEEDGAVTILIDVAYSLDFFEGLDDDCSSSANARVGSFSLLSRSS